MKRNMMIMPLVALALMASCTGKKTEQNVADNDSMNVVDSTAEKAAVDLVAVAGTYEGTLPAADCPGIKPC